MRNAGDRLDLRGVQLEIDAVSGELPQGGAQRLEQVDDLFGGARIVLQVDIEELLDPPIPANFSARRKVGNRKLGWGRQINWNVSARLSVL